MTLCPNCTLGELDADGICEFCGSPVLTPAPATAPAIAPVTAPPSLELLVEPPSLPGFSSGESPLLTPLEVPGNRLPPPLPPAALDELIGLLVAERYLVQRLVGSGGMGRVYEASQIDLQRRVALKVLHAHHATDPRHKERFHREARAASRLAHPGSVIVHDFGEWAGRLYLTMEFLEGISLDKLLREGGAFPLARALHIALQVGEVLVAAHAQGVLHRDLKPGNILLLPGPGGLDQVKVVDFGLALLLDRGEKRLTREGAVVGTPAYMAPEQFREQEVDARSDLYSLGVLLFELLTGQLPFAGATAEYMVQTLYLDPPSPARLAPDQGIPEALEQLILRLLAKSKEARPDSAAEVVAELRGLLDGTYGRPEERARSKTLLLGDRQARADAFGLQRPPVQSDFAGAEEGEVVLTVEQAVEFAGSITALLRAQDFPALSCPSLDELLALPGCADAGAVVVELGEEPASLLEELARLLAARRLPAIPLIVVGPDDGFPLMARALELGLAGYVPRSVLAAKLPRLLRRLQRHRHPG
ncbi:MAG: serine/threonine-protein kinase [Myxococcota bacterium]|nr:serine/threonine-protein kinase [Myxococcota bacterium]